MTRSEAIERLSVSLTDALQKWLDEQCDSPAWWNLGIHYDDEPRLMAKAAMLILETGASNWESLVADGQIGA